MVLAQYKVEKLVKRNNFIVWRVKMQDLLVQQGLLKVLSSKDKLPESMSKDESNSRCTRIVSYNNFV